MNEKTSKECVTAEKYSTWHKAHSLIPGCIAICLPPDAIWLDSHDINPKASVVAQVLFVTLDLLLNP
jgi:hypothetical protein